MLTTGRGRDILDVAAIIIVPSCTLSETFSGEFDRHVLFGGDCGQRNDGVSRDSQKTMPGILQVNTARQVCMYNSKAWMLVLSVVVELGG
jgi:hypothetical protein